MVTTVSVEKSICLLLSKLSLLLCTVFCIVFLHWGEGLFFCFCCFLFATGVHIFRHWWNILYKKLVKLGNPWFLKLIDSCHADIYSISSSNLEWCTILCEMERKLLSYKYLIMNCDISGGITFWGARKTTNLHSAATDEKQKSKVRVRRVWEPVRGSWGKISGDQLKLGHGGCVIVRFLVLLFWSNVCCFVLTDCLWGSYKGKGRDEITPRKSRKGG